MSWAMEIPSALSQARAAIRAPCRLVVLTGGPGAGKTALLELARRSLGPQIAILPEAASILFRGGFWRRSSLAASKAAQRAIFHVQREQERMVVEEQEFSFALCDRGTLDCLAYWPDTEQSFWRELGTRQQAEYDRYHAVIHLRTPSLDQSAEQPSPHPIGELVSPQEIDERILRIWDGHPNRHIVHGAQDFLLTVTTAIGLIRRVLPSHL